MEFAITVFVLSIPQKMPKLLLLTYQTNMYRDVSSKSARMLVMTVQSSCAATPTVLTLPGRLSNLPQSKDIV
ncbi:MAG: hypothetical protein O3B03_01005 [Proteobacteria bacterium]|nr:hypothetical protein [Pseudomonadota bacterium]MDA1331063.1 hypothetical protein [Pseudomonadota bacterium]